MSQDHQPKPSDQISSDEEMSTSPPAPRDHDVDGVNTDKRSDRKRKPQSPPAQHGDQTPAQDLAKRVREDPDYQKKMDYAHDVSIQASLKAAVVIDPSDIHPFWLKLHEILSKLKLDPCTPTTHVWICGNCGLLKESFPKYAQPSPQPSTSTAEHASNPQNTHRATPTESVQPSRSDQYVPSYENSPRSLAGIVHLLDFQLKPLISPLESSSDSKTPPEISLMSNSAYCSPASSSKSPEDSPAAQTTSDHRKLSVPGSSGTSGIGSMGSASPMTPATGAVRTVSDPTHTSRQLRLQAGSTSPPTSSISAASTSTLTSSELQTGNTRRGASMSAPVRNATTTATATSTSTSTSTTTTTQTAPPPLPSTLPTRHHYQAPVTLRAGRWLNMDSRPEPESISRAAPLSMASVSRALGFGNLPEFRAGFPLTPNILAPRPLRAGEDGMFVEDPVRRESRPSHSYFFSHLDSDRYFEDSVARPPSAFRPLRRPPSPSFMRYRIHASGGLAPASQSDYSGPSLPSEQSGYGGESSTVPTTVHDSEESQPARDDMDLNIDSPDTSVSVRAPKPPSIEDVLGPISSDDSQFTMASDAATVRSSSRTLQASSITVSEIAASPAIRKDSTSSSRRCSSSDQTTTGDSSTNQSDINISTPSCEDSDQNMHGPTPTSDQTIAGSTPSLEHSVAGSTPTSDHSLHGSTPSCESPSANPNGINGNAMRAPDF